ncbi:hypothetical protein AAG570_007759 [Ranatra chinensis]|uniref:Uncharacterized protein n=1 Tax=Ranatra chinensis TaxID=642074 RepID=A0ABD0XUJ1_9HEMI
MFIILAGFKVISHLFERKKQADGQEDDKDGKENDKDDGGCDEKDGGDEEEYDKDKKEYKKGDGGNDKKEGGEENEEEDDKDEGGDEDSDENGCDDGGDYDNDADEDDDDEDRDDDEDEDDDGDDEDEDDDGDDEDEDDDGDDEDDPSIMVVQSRTKWIPAGGLLWIPFPNMRKICAVNTITGRIYCLKDVGRDDNKECDKQDGKGDNKEGGGEDGHVSEDKPSKLGSLSRIMRWPIGTLLCILLPSLGKKLIVNREAGEIYCVRHTEKEDEEEEDEEDDEVEDDNAQVNDDDEEDKDDNDEGRDDDEEEDDKGQGGDEDEGSYDDEEDGWDYDDGGDDEDDPSIMVVQSRTKWIPAGGLLWIPFPNMRKICAVNTITGRIYCLKDVGRDDNKECDKQDRKGDNKEGGGEDGHVSEDKPSKLGSLSRIMRWPIGTLLCILLPSLGKKLIVNREAGEIYCVRHTEKEDEEEEDEEDDEVEDDNAQVNDDEEEDKDDNDEGRDDDEEEDDKDQGGDEDEGSYDDEEDGWDYDDGGDDEDDPSIMVVQSRTKWIPAGGLLWIPFPNMRKICAVNTITGRIYCLKDVGRDDNKECDKQDRKGDNKEGGGEDGHVSEDKPSKLGSLSRIMRWPIGTLLCILLPSLGKKLIVNREAGEIYCVRHTEKEDEEEEDEEDKDVNDEGGY